MFLSNWKSIYICSADSFKATYAHTKMINLINFWKDKYHNNDHSLTFFIFLKLRIIGRQDFFSKLSLILSNIIYGIGEIHHRRRLNDKLNFINIPIK